MARRAGRMAVAASADQARIPRIDRSPGGRSVGPTRRSRRAPPGSARRRSSIANLGDRSSSMSRPSRSRCCTRSDAPSWYSQAARTRSTMLIAAISSVSAAEREPRAVDAGDVVARADVHGHRPGELDEEPLGDVDPPAARVAIHADHLDQGHGDRSSIAADARYLAGHDRSQSRGPSVPVSGSLQPDGTAGSRCGASPPSMISMSNGPGSCSTRPPEHEDPPGYAPGGEIDGPGGERRDRDGVVPPSPG